MPPTALAMRRIMRDVNSLDNLEEQGIYYVADESNVARGTAMLIGQPDTPYAGGFYFFSIEFPDDYPFSPIRARSLTQDGVTRFNPNMYIDGKVCLSILNTWHDGPQWTGVQTLQSVLLALMSAVLNANPLENEPCYRRCGASPDAVAYNRAILHANAWTAIYLQMKDADVKWPAFADFMKAELPKYLTKVISDLTAAAAEWDGREEVIRAYNMRVRYRFAAAADALQTLCGAGA